MREGKVASIWIRSVRGLVKASSADQHTLHTMHTLHMVTAEPGEAHDARSQANPRPPGYPDTRESTAAWIQILATFPSRIYRREVKSTLSQRHLWFSFAFSCADAFIGNQTDNSREIPTCLRLSSSTSRSTLLCG